MSLLGRQATASVKWATWSAGGLAVFAAQAVAAAHHQVPVLDEGTYLLKGLLFARGVYKPFQPYGPWSNHMPLSFLIPGYLQKWLGAGLATGRYTTIIMAVLALLGMWWLVFQIAGGKWAAASVWAFAVMPAAAKIYSLAVSEALAAMFFVWALALLAIPQPSRWRLVLGGLLAGILTMTRVNMTAAWLILGLFALWQWRRRGLWFWVPSLVVVIGLHVLYWPRIVWLWARWLPATIPVPAMFKPSLQNAAATYRASPEFWTRVTALWNAIRAFPLAWAGVWVGTTAVFVAQKRDGYRYRFLAMNTALAWLLVLLHGWASIGGAYCIDCFAMYTGFYAPALVALASMGLWLPWKTRQSLAERFWLVGVVFFVSAALTNIAVFIADTEQIFERRHLPAVWLRALLYWPQIHFFPEMKPMDAARIFWGSLGLAIVLILVGTMWMLRRPRRLFAAGQKTTWKTTLIVLALLSPLTLFSGDWGTYDCAQDALTQHTKTAAALSQILSPGTKVYWAAYFNTLLLQTNDVILAPQQLNGDYNRLQGGDADALASWGYWNQTLDAHWMKEADVIVADEAHLSHLPLDYHSLGFKPVQRLSFLPSCTDRRGKLIILKRAP